uniref:Integrase catalytic domain-containing protein n=1 Tax=Tanacetum cinerariifolium TaxID=118510 RepID=A0A6L2K5U7_TANCI|nr:hypothetical protein [Tanacetum cinerariifolium]
MERKKALTVNPEQHQASPGRSPNEAAMVDDMLVTGSDMAKFNKPKCDVHQVGDKREVEVLHSFNWPPSQLITDDGVLLERAVYAGAIYRTEVYTETKHNKIPLWVKFTNVLMEAWSNEGLSAVASSVGKPIIMDHMTANVRKNRTGKESVELQYRGKNNVVKGTKIVKIEYDWKPHICNHCMVFGYSWQQCKKRKRTTEKVFKDLKTNMYDNRKGGFQFDGGKNNVEKVNVESGNNKEKSFKEEFPSLLVRNDKGKNDVITPGKGRQENNYSVLADVESDDLDEIKMLKDIMIVEQHVVHVDVILCMDEIFTKKLSSEDALIMVREVTDEEVKPAIFDIGYNQKSGPKRCSLKIDIAKAYDTMTTTVVNNLVFAFFEKQKLYGPNFIDWYRQLRLVRSAEDKLNYLELLIPAAPIPAVVGQPVPLKTLAAHAAWVKGQKEIVLLMLMTMEPDLQRNLENLSEYDMLKELKTLFSQQAEQKLLQTVREFHACKKEEGQYECDSFVQNYNMHSMGKTVNELHAMLKLLEQTLPKRDVPALHVIRVGKGKKLPQGASTSGIFTIELFTFPGKSLVYDAGRRTLCNTTQGLRRSRKLKPGALSLYIDNGQHAAVKATGSYDLYFPISKNNLIYFNVVPRDGIFEIVLSNSNTIDRSMYAVSNKRAKLNLDSSLLWHCHLGYISKKHIKKLQHDRLLNSIDTKSFEKCVSCLSGKMARKPYSHQVERAKDLLGLIHTNVCVPFKIFSRQGASYCVTFTDNFSHYGYVYMLKHKHDVFETFKVFQKEVENQLEKIIKLLHFDRGGEYTTHEFLDHLKEHGITSHHTPPYIPQHNRVYERRNRTLLDMVHSMMSQTTLPKSFWDYSLETVSCILNMVPNKKVERHHTKIPKKTMGYYFYYPPENKVFVARNVKFFKNILITQEASRSLDDLELIQEEDTHLFENTSSHHDEGDQEIDEPQNPEFDKWPNAMNVEIQSMKDNKVWDLFDLPPKGKTIGSNWLFKKKTDMDEAVHTYKARLVAKGFTQTPRINYEETFSLVVDIRAIRILIAIAAFYDYAI